MNRLLPLVLTLPLAAALAGCGATADESVVAGRPEEPVVGPADGPALAVGVYGMASVKNLWTGKPNFRTDLPEWFIDGGQFPNARVLPPEGCKDGCDIVALVKCAEDLGSPPASVAVFSGRTKQKLFETSRGGSCFRAAKALGAEVAGRFRPGTRPYLDVAAEKGSVPAAASAAAPAPAAATLTREEVQGLIAAAFAKGAASAKPADAPSDVDAPSYTARPRPDDFALVIGIGKYADLPEAQYAERDAAAVRAHLLALGVPERNVISLTGDKATAVAIKKYVDSWLPRNVNENSTVFVYYSGHGAPDPKTGSPYLVPWDGDPQFLSDTAYPVAGLYEKLGALKARRVLVALDSCFSGAGGRSVLAKGARPLVAKVDAARAGGKVVALTASGADEISGSLDAQRHGLFTYYLLKGLNGAAASGGRVTLRGLYDFAKPRVADEARRQNRDQSVQLLGDDADLTLR